MLATLTRRETVRALREELPDLLSERGLSIRGLARELGINDSFLTRVLKGTKSPSADLTRRITKTLGLPPGYFVEDREAAVIDAVRADPRLRDRLYAELRQHGAGGHDRP
jgi:transcriptional regulator with XRE-family HTH domain